MKKTILSYTGILLLSMSFNLTASAETFRIVGKIQRTLVSQYYAGCMILLDKTLENSCPSRWVSLDCKGLFNDKDIEKGKRMFSSAMAAAHAGKTIAMYINNTHKASGYCVASRLDVYF